MALTDNARSLYAEFYYALRIYLHKNRRLLRIAQILRAYLIIGPQRAIVLRYFQKFCTIHHKPLTTDASPLFPTVDMDEIVNRINHVGYAHIGDLPEEYVKQILEYCKINKRIKYWNSHKDCEAVDRISRNVTIVEIARRYLGAEPILWLTQLKWSFALSDDPSNLLSSLHQEPVQYDSHAFHYDIIDFKSLSLFVYLTDVDQDCYPHVIIEGTHRHKTLKEIRSIVLDDDVADKKYHDRINVILGKKGTVFFEDTSCFHKVADGTKSRLILAIDYVLRRKIPPDRPLVVG